MKHLPLFDKIPKFSNSLEILKKHFFFYCTVFSCFQHSDCPDFGRAERIRQTQQPGRRS